MREPTYYKLENREAVPCDVMEWATWFESAERHVDKDEIGGVGVSTVFLGVDHNYLENGPPILFETMVFGGALDQEQRRYSTWAEAEAGHADMVKRVRKAMN